MLVVSRKAGERLLIGDSIAVTVVKVAGGGVRLGVEAPPELAVMREELAEQIEAEQEQAAAAETPDSAADSVAGVGQSLLGDRLV